MNDSNRKVWPPVRGPFPQHPPVPALHVGFQMPETPDFDQMAQQLDSQWRVLIAHQESEQSQDVIASRVRQVWNARGAADIVKLDTELSAMMGNSAAGPYVKNLDRAIRKLDR